MLPRPLAGIRMRVKKGGEGTGREELEGREETKDGEGKDKWKFEPLPQCEIVHTLRHATIL